MPEGCHIVKIQSTTKDKLLNIKSKYGQVRFHSPGDRHLPYLRLIWKFSIICRNFAEKTSMISRRVLRIKAMQALYSFFQSESERPDIAEKNMIKDVNAIYELYIHHLSFVLEIVDFARESIEISRNKYFPSEEEKNPNTRLVDSQLVRILENNSVYLQRRELFHVNWADQKELIRKIYLQMKESEFYNEFLGSEPTLRSDMEFFSTLYTELIGSNEVLLQEFEERNVFWADDDDIIHFMIHKTFKNIAAEGDKYAFPRGLFDDGHHHGNEDEELKFVRDLFRKTIVHAEEYDRMIENKAENWEIDRIAMMDLLLIKMALCEFMEFPSIPTKVTINEYIEISKYYSTPKSKVFINGLLDKLLFDLSEQKKIHKSGRGLIG